jgi:hypothetical protein
MNKLARMREWFRKLPSRMVATRDLYAGRLALGKAELFLTVIRADGTTKDLGCVARKKVTGSFVTDIVACLAVASPYTVSTTAFQAYKFHAMGTGTNAEANTDTALQIDSGVSRVTGTQVKAGTASAPTYTSVATMAFTSTLAITEHAVFNASTSGTMLDRSVFSAVNVVNGDSIQATYVLTINAEP